MTVTVAVPLPPQAVPGQVTPGLQPQVAAGRSAWVWTKTIACAIPTAIGVRRVVRSTPSTKERATLLGFALETIQNSIFRQALHAQWKCAWIAQASVKNALLIRALLVRCPAGLAPTMSLR